MSLYIIVYLAGILTILSPCILPVLPFVFASTQKSFVKGALPLLLGMSVTFSAFSALAIIGGEWVVGASQWGRGLALVFLSLFALALLFPSISEKIFAPAVNFGSKIGVSPTQGQGPRFGSSLLIGVSTGFLWAPCAGPILGLVLTGAAVQKNLLTSIFLLMSYSAGASSSLALALVSGQKFLGSMKKALGVDQVVKKVLGALVLVGVAVIALGLDQKILGPISKIETAGLEEKLLGVLASQKKSEVVQTQTPGWPDFPEGLQWFNSKALTQKDLQGKVVLIDFWTYSCINCLHTLPSVKDWAAKYKDQGLVVIGVHTPEFGFEKVPDNVKKAIADLGVTYPVVLDNDFKIWNSFQNRYWPAHYFINRQGQVVYHHFGEGNYQESEEKIKELLMQPAGVLGKALGSDLPSTSPATSGTPSPQAAAAALPATPETYLGLGKTHSLITVPRAQDEKILVYKPIELAQLHHWTVQGRWALQDTFAETKEKGDKLKIQFLGRSAHIVLASDKPQGFLIKVDGQPPKAWHGVDIDEEGRGQVSGNRLYDILANDTSKSASVHNLEIEFLAPGIQAYSLTFD
jgi:cytochrome c biogenesis protein CcdA/thiol-disulfide isomerase/thioredoxin